MDTGMITATPVAITNWDDYAQPFSSVMPQVMVELNREVASLMYGDVVDFGCGGGKAIPFIFSNSEVRSYTGIDASMEMIRCARWIADQFDGERATLINGRIEDTAPGGWNCALSVNSYYVWEHPEQVLEKIHACLTENARFVLATINPDIDLPGLLEEANKEMVAHPHWAAFREHNLRIDAVTRGKLVDMDTLVRQLIGSGFHIEQATSQLYAGGLNLVTCRRGS